jgi:hypothetical protein
MSDVDDPKTVVLAINAWSVVTGAVVDGLGYGWMRLFKHRDKPEGLPQDDVVVQELAHHVMNALSDVVNWNKSGVAAGIEIPEENDDGDIT